MNKTIMVAMDKQDDRETIKTLLKKNNYNVITSTNCKNCLAKIKKYKPHLILIGSFQSRTNILEEVQKIKDIKIIHITTDIKEKENLKLYRNVIGFIEEPFDIKEFLKKIDKLLN
jgi:DNA-binding NtrC family response regulator